MDYAEKDKNLILSRLSSNGGSADVSDFFVMRWNRETQNLPSHLSACGARLSGVSFDELGAPVKVRLK